MRTQAIEKVLRKIIREVDTYQAYDEDGVPNDTKTLENLAAKAKIVLDRGDDRAASVIRELINE